MPTGIFVSKNSQKSQAQNKFCSIARVTRNSGTPHIVYVCQCQDARVARKSGKPLIVYYANEEIWVPFQDSQSCSIYKYLYLLQQDNFMPHSNLTGWTHCKDWHQATYVKDYSRTPIIAWDFLLQSSREGAGLVTKWHNVVGSKF